MLPPLSYLAQAPMIVLVGLNLRVSAPVLTASRRSGVRDMSATRQAGPLVRLVWLWRRVYPGRNPLARGADYLEFALIALAVVIAVAAIPVGAAVASNAYATQAQQADEQRSVRQPTKAVLLADAPMAVLGPYGSGRGAVAEVPAQWRGVGGTQVTGTVPVGAGTTAGSELTIWLDGQGTQVEAPMTPAGVVIATVAGTVLAWFGLVATLVAVLLPAHILLDRYRCRYWERDWARVSARWSRY